MKLNESLSEQFLEKYSETGRFTYGSVRNIQPICHPDKTQLVFLRSKGPCDPTLCLWLFDTKSSNQTLLVDPINLANSKNLTDEEKANRERLRENSAGITSYNLDKNKKIICFQIHGSLYIYKLENYELISLHELCGSKNVFDPRISSDGKKISYLSENNLEVLISETTDWEIVERKILLESKTPTIKYGQAEFIAAEEMRRTRGHWWSPNSDAIIATRTDESMVDDLWISNPADPNKKPRPVKYPAAGTNNAEIELLLTDLEANTSPIRWKDSAESHKFEYLTNVEWENVSDHPRITRQTRDQKVIETISINLENNSIENILTRSDENWVEIIPSSPTVYKNHVISIQEINSRALYIDARQVTTDLYVRSLLGGINDNYFFSASEDATETHIYSINIESFEVQKLTSKPAVHKCSIEDDLLIISSYGKANTMQMYSYEPNKGLTEVTDLSKLNASETPEIEPAPNYFIPANNIYTAVFIPEEHDGGPLPVLLDPYGGPHAQRVTKINNSHLISQWFANQGFLVVVTDGRGTPGNSPSWEKTVKGNLATPALEDQLTALDFVLNKYTYADKSKVAIRGWSFGGYLAALAAIEAPEKIHAAIVGAPVTDWRLYDTHYTERYLGDPNIEKEAYDRCDLLTKAAGLKTPMMIIHGMADDNVFYSNSIKLSSELVNNGINHEMYSLINVTHMTPQKNLTTNLLKLQLDFLNKNLKNTTVQEI